MNKYKPEMLIHIYDDEDIDMYETFESAYDMPKIVLRDEAFLIFYILLQSNENLKDLVKVSLCFYIDDKLAKKKAISSCWICEGAKCGSSIDEEDMEEIEKLYKNKNKTHNDMIKILNISGLRGCGFNVLSEHYIIDKN
jgi:hypothetical protein